METELSNILLQSATDRPDLLPRIQRLAADIESMVQSSQTLTDYGVLEERTKDAELLRFITSTLQACEELPNLRQKDYQAYMTLIALSRESGVVAFLLDHLTFAYIRNYQVEELLFFSDLVYAFNSRNILLNGLYNFVCGFFRNERRDIMKRREYRITNEQFARAEHNIPHMGARSFRKDVEIKSFRVYSVKELAVKCGMTSGNFRKEFVDTFGIAPKEWIDEQRKEDIKHLLKSPSLTLAEVARQTGFATTSSFSHYCMKHLHFSPGQLRAFYY